MKGTKIAMNSRSTRPSRIHFPLKFRLLTEMDNLTPSLLRHSISFGKQPKSTKVLSTRVAKRVLSSNFSDGPTLILNKNVLLSPKQAGWVLKCSLLRNQSSLLNGLRTENSTLGGSITSPSAINLADVMDLETSSET